MTVDPVRDVAGFPSAARNTRTVVVARTRTTYLPNSHWLLSSYMLYTYRTHNINNIVLIWWKNIVFVLYCTRQQFFFQLILYTILHVSRGQTFLIQYNQLNAMEM